MLSQSGGAPGSPVPDLPGGPGAPPLSARGFLPPGGWGWHPGCPGPAVRTRAQDAPQTLKAQAFLPAPATPDLTEANCHVPKMGLRARWLPAFQVQGGDRNHGRVKPLPLRGTLPGEGPRGPRAGDWLVRHTPAAHGRGASSLGARAEPARGQPQLPFPLSPEGGGGLGGIKD